MQDFRDRHLESFGPGASDARFGGRESPELLVCTQASAPGGRWKAGVSAALLSPLPSHARHTPGK